MIKRIKYWDKKLLKNKNNIYLKEHKDDNQNKYYDDHSENIGKKK